MKIEYFQASNKQYYFHVKARNGRVIASSEGYLYKADCIKTAKSMRLKLMFAPIIEV